MIRNFIWKGKKSKIAYNILQNPKKEGGLNLVNLVNKDKALKATWPQILYQEEDYSIMVYATMRMSTIKEDIWRCSLSAQDAKKLKIPNQFWEDVLSSWCEYNYTQPYSIDNQLIWYNSRIRIGGKPFFWADAFKKGLKYVHQLFSNECLQSPEQVEQQYGLHKLRYNSLITAIPKEWKTYFEEFSKTMYIPIRPHVYDIVTQIHTQGLSGRVYKWLSDDVMIIHNKYLLWLQELGRDFCEGICDFGKLHQNIYKITNVPKYRSFQYRILQRGLVTNIQLYKWGIKESNMCSFCGMQTETVVHLLCECPNVLELWEQLSQYIEQRYNQQVDLSPKNIIVNTIIKLKYHAINFMCLVTKQYIYAQRCMGKPLSFQQLRATLVRIENIEKYISVKNDKLQLHIKKWSSQSLNIQREIVSSDICEYLSEYMQEM